MNDTNLTTLDQVRDFLLDTRDIGFSLEDKSQRYAFVRLTLIRFEYYKLNKPDKGLVLNCLTHVTGYSRILDEVKGVYHINAVDEVTQMEVVCSVKKISERFLIPIPEQLLDQFPFEIHGFHADNGLEYINRHVVQLLNKLMIELTKSRARHSNDNALVEPKNGSIVRKHLGYVHIPQQHAELINDFNKTHLNQDAPQSLHQLSQTLLLSVHCPVQVNISNVG